MGSEETPRGPQTPLSLDLSPLERLRVLATASAKAPPPQHGPRLIPVKPETILALLDVVEAAKKAIDCGHPPIGEFPGEIEECFCWVEPLRDALSRLEQQ